MATSGSRTRPTRSSPATGSSSSSSPPARRSPSARCERPRLPGERRSGKAGDPGARPVHAARLRLLAVRHLFARGGDVELVERLAAERARGDLADRQLQHLLEAPVRAVAPDGRAAEESDPEAALAVDRQAVGQPLLLADGDERPAVRQLAVV